MRVFVSYKFIEAILSKKADICFFKITTTRSFTLLVNSHTDKMQFAVLKECNFCNEMKRLFHLFVAVDRIAQLDKASSLFTTFFLLSGIQYLAGN